MRTWIAARCTSSSGTYRPRMAAPVYNSHDFTGLVSRVKTGQPSDPAYTDMYAHGNQVECETRFVSTPFTGRNFYSARSP